jgi:hypothetical protein
MKTLSLHISDEYLWIVFRIIILFVFALWFVILKPVSWSAQQKIAWPRFLVTSLLACGMFALCLYMDLNTDGKALYKFGNTFYKFITGENEPLGLSDYKDYKYIAYFLAPNMLVLMLAATFTGAILSRIGGPRYTERLKALPIKNFVSKLRNDHVLVRALAWLNVVGLIFEILSPSHVPIYISAMILGWVIVSSVFLPLSVLYAAWRSPKSERKTFLVDALYVIGGVLFFWSVLIVSWLI